MNTFFRIRYLSALSAAMLGLLCQSAWANPECIVAAKPGGGMDVSCKLRKKAIRAGGMTQELALNYLPGGIGAVAWSSVVSHRRGGADSLVTFSGGSLLNLAQGKYGKAGIADVRWVAAIGTDYGMIVVRKDSPYRNLRELFSAIQQDPSKVTIGASGTVGSQDWLKIALIARYAKVDPKNFRFVALEGGGEAFTALQANYVQVVSGDASEAALYAPEGKFRVLAVLSDARLPGVLADVPTAREQGFDVTWPLIRGFYMSPYASDADYKRWVGIFDKMMKSKEFEQQRQISGLFPFAMTGSELTEYIKKTVEHYKKQSQELDLIR
ncbi:Bug family tripartite tricarboxylate transporter substrate binding protein [Herbaspirillum autotrophicum]|uniref:Bug family tripartite tricarboxylate transporter substrate binding protein n=1 Tax=Herbaspirillum autotrophicum TaxID=180195 RepID=UPI00067BEE34